MHTVLVVVVVDDVVVVVVLVLVDVVDDVVVVVVTTPWLMTNGKPAITNVALRGTLGVGLAGTVNVTVPAPFPTDGWTVIQLAKFCTVHAQLGAVVTPTVPLPPPTPIVALFALKV